MVTRSNVLLLGILATVLVSQVLCVQRGYFSVGSEWMIAPVMLVADDIWRKRHNKHKRHRR